MNAEKGKNSQTKMKKLRSRDMLPVFFVIALLVPNIIIVSFCTTHNYQTHSQEFTKPHPQDGVWQSISHDVKDGAEYSSQELHYINWTVKGYVGHQYLLKENDQVQGLGTIYNSTVVIPQELERQTGECRCEIFIIANGEVIETESVTIILTESFWNSTWFVVVVGIVASLSVVGGIFYWRKKTRGKSKREIDLPTSSLQDSEIEKFLLVPQGKEDEAHLFFLSSCRIEKICIYSFETQNYVYHEILKPITYPIKERAVLEEELHNYLQKYSASIQSWKTPIVAKLFGMKEMEYLLVCPVSEDYALLMLFEERISRLYLQKIQKSALKLKKLLENTTKEEKNFYQIQDLFEYNLQIKRSYEYTLPMEFKLPQLGKLLGRDLPDLEEIMDDVQGLTLGESTGMIQNIRERRTREETVPLFEEVEIL